VPPRGEEGGATPCASAGEGGPVTAWGRGRGGVGERLRGSEERESEGERERESGLRERGGRRYFGWFIPYVGHF